MHVPDLSTVNDCLSVVSNGLNPGFAPKTRPCNLARDRLFAGNWQSLWEDILAMFDRHLRNSASPAHFSGRHRVGEDVLSVRLLKTRQCIFVNRNSRAVMNAASMDNTGDPFYTMACALGRITQPGVTTISGAEGLVSWNLKPH